MRSCVYVSVRTDADAAARPNPYCEQIEECGGLDRLEELQNHQSQEIYKAAVDLLQNYFVDGADDEGAIAGAGDRGFGFVVDPADAAAAAAAGAAGAAGAAALLAYAAEKAARSDSGPSDGDGPESDDGGDGADMMFSFGGGEVNANPFG